MNTALSQKVIWGVGIAAVVLLGFLLFWFFRRSDPAAQGPIPYKPFDPGAHAGIGPGNPFAKPGTGGPAGSHGPGGTGQTSTPH